MFILNSYFWRVAMSIKTVKVAVSLPVEEYRQVEKARKQRRISRSAIISEAIKHWIAANREQEKIHAYVEGYQRLPETARELKLFESLAGEVLAAEEWKE
jgi:metal-responsive CopG/Arc/MetJ family transcriptional regulator